MKKLILGLQILGLVLVSQAFAGATRTTNTLYVDQSNNMVYEVDHNGIPTGWSYGGGGELSSPSDAERLPGGTVTLICDYGNNRVIEVYPDYSTKTVYGTDSFYPVDAERKGTLTLITEYSNSRVIEVDGSGGIIWLLGGLNAPPVDAEYLGNGNILIVEGSPGNRVYEVDYATKIVVKSYTDLGPEPSDAEALPNGNWLITNTGSNTVIEVASKTTGWDVVWKCDKVWDGYSWQLLNQPKDAERLSDGNTLIAENYMGYAGVIDVTPEGTVTWQHICMMSMNVPDAEEVLGTDTIYNTAYMYYQNEAQQWMPYAAAFATNTLHIVTGPPIGTPTIVLTKEVEPTGQVSKGATLTYIIHFENTSEDGTATECVLYDSIPAGCELDTTNPPPAWTNDGLEAEIWYSYDGGTIWSMAWGLGVTTIKWKLTNNIGPCPSPSSTGSVGFKVNVK